MSIAATNGADDDWHDIVGEHEHALRRFIGRRMANRHLVDDALQETYLRAFRSPHPPDGRWLRFLARRASVDVYRGEPPPGPDADPLSMVAEWAAADQGDLPGSDEHVAAIASRQAVRAAFRRLSPRHRRLLVLRGVHELTYDEIARQEGVSPEALTSALNRARERLRAGIADYEARERAWPAVVAGTGVLERLRLRLWRAQSSLASAPFAELAGTALGIGLVAAATVTASVDARPSILAVASAARPAADEPARAPDARTEHATAPAAPPRPLATPTGTVAPPRPPARPIVDGDARVRLSPDQSVVRVGVDSATVTGSRTAWATVTFSCSGSTTVGTACPVLDEVPDGD